MGDNRTLFWILFNLGVVVLLVLDLAVFHRKSHVIRIKEALSWSAFWIALAVAFGGFLWWWLGGAKALEYFTGYLIEKSLSVDNLFVFLIIFQYFHVPRPYQYKVLFWGILGALMMRALFIFAGVALIQRFHWVVYIFGAFLVYTGMKMWGEKEKEIHPERNPVLQLVRRRFPVTKNYEQDRFFTRHDGRSYLTPLFVVLLVVESTDVLFAADSIPAILAITHDPLIVYSSNVFAILGLRALFFALAGLMQMFRYLHYGLSVILVFVGAKMIASGFLHIPVPIALGAVLGILTVAVGASMYQRRQEGKPLFPSEEERDSHLDRETARVPDPEAAH
jgi:tellurite resistance protein TerC